MNYAITFTVNGETETIEIEAPDAQAAYYVLMAVVQPRPRYALHIVSIKVVR